MRVADGHHELAHAQVLGVAQLGRGQTIAVGPNHGQVRERIAAHDVKRVLGAVHERGPALAPAALHHVGGGEHEAVRGEDDGAPRSRRQTAT